MKRLGSILFGSGIILLLALVSSAGRAATEPAASLAKERPDIVKSLAELDYPTKGWLSTKTMTPEEEDVVEAVFRDQFSSLRAGRWKVFCLYTHTKFPPRSLIRRFAGHKPKVVPAKRCYRGDRVMRFGASWIRHLEDGHVLVIGGYDGRTEVYEVLRTKSGWKVIRARTLFII